MRLVIRENHCGDGRKEGYTIHSKGYVQQRDPFVAFTRIELSPPSSRFIQAIHDMEGELCGFTGTTIDRVLKEMGGCVALILDRIKKP